MRGTRGTFERTAFESKASSRALLENRRWHWKAAALWRRQGTKKGALIPDANKLDPLIITLFFCARCAPGRHCRPAYRLGCVFARVTPFHCGETSGYRAAARVRGTPAAAGYTSPGSPGPYADHVDCKPDPSHVDKRVCKGKRAL